MTNVGKPLTFAAMLVRAQRRFDALGKTFPNTGDLLVAQMHASRQAAPPARRVDALRQAALAG